SGRLTPTADPTPGGSARSRGAASRSASGRRPAWGRAATGGSRPPTNCAPVACAGDAWRRPSGGTPPTPVTGGVTAPPQDDGGSPAANQAESVAMEAGDRREETLAP